MLTVLAFVGLILIGDGTPAAADTDADQITWIEPEHQPFFFTKGPRAGTGLAQRISRALIARMPRFRHEILVANTRRSVVMMAERDGCCMVGIAKRYEGGRIALSRRGLSIFSTHVIYRTADRDKFAPYILDGNRIDLDRLLLDRQLVTSLVRGRYYSTGIIELVRRHQDRLSHLTQAVKPETPFQQLRADWIDYALGQPFAAFWHLGCASRACGDTFGFLRVAGEPVTHRAYIGCSNRPVGRRALAALDALLDRPEVRTATTAGIRRRIAAMAHVLPVDSTPGFLEWTADQPAQ